jgi:hypothetical protein
LKLGNLDPFNQKITKSVITVSISATTVFLFFTKLNFYYYLHIGLWKMMMFLSKTLKWQFWPEHTFESILVYSGSHYEAWFCCQRSVATKKIFVPTKKNICSNKNTLFVVTYQHSTHMGIFRQKSYKTCPEFFDVFLGGHLTVDYYLITFKIVYCLL